MCLFICVFVFAYVVYSYGYLCSYYWLVFPSTQERNIVSEVSGTTRDCIDEKMSWKEHEVTLVDTAGIARTSTHEKGGLPRVD